MPLPNIFDKEVSYQTIKRIGNLNPQTKPVWGKMTVAQMLAHCCVTYEYVYENKYPKPNFFKKLILKSLVKPIVVTEKPFPKNSRTAPDFLIRDERDFDVEKTRLTGYILRTQELGAAYFDGKDSHSFGKLSIQEWNNMFYKHLNHHLTQFGV